MAVDILRLCLLHVYIQVNFKFRAVKGLFNVQIPLAASIKDGNRCITTYCYDQSIYPHLPLPNVPQRSMARVLKALNAPMFL